MGMLDSAATVLYSDPTKKTVAVKSRLPSLPPRSLCFLVSAWRNICPKEKNNLFLFIVFTSLFSKTVSVMWPMSFLAHKGSRELFWSKFVLSLLLLWPSSLSYIFYILTFFSTTTGPISTKLGTKHHILGWKGFKFVQMKGPALFQGEIIVEIVKIHWQNLKIYFSRTTGSISTKASLDEGDSNLFILKTVQFSWSR